MNEQQLRSMAEEWMAQDPDDETRAELSGLLSRADWGEIADRFGAQLEFGTAGLRGVLGAGPNRMNRAVVLRTARGLAEYLLANCANATARGVVIAYDGRHKSRQFAEDTAEVMARAGIVSHFFENVCPTPLLAFAVNELGAAAGVMVTASHNPREYNGYKVYAENGAQIISPADAEIAQTIEKVVPANQVPTTPLAEALVEGSVVRVPPEVREAYIARVVGLTRHPELRGELPVVYTPLHGVGGDLARDCFARAGFHQVHFVPEQFEPHPDFPTVAFPNPEEKGALDLALALAEREHAELVLANDPDADRMAAAVRGANGKVTQLSGNQIGVLLGHYLLSHPSRDSQASGKGGGRLVVTSIVSSPMLAEMARALNVHYDETLTGFKWIANVAIRAKSQNIDFVFGYEEALGYSVGDLVRDKDGISAAVLFAELAEVCKSNGRTVLDALEELYRAYGLYVSSQRSITMKGLRGLVEIESLMARLRGAPSTQVDAWPVRSVRDYQTSQLRHADGQTERLTLPPSNVLVYDLEGGGRVIVRPSGTEPKVKFYFDHRETIAPGESLPLAEDRARSALGRLERATLEHAGLTPT